MAFLSKPATGEEASLRRDREGDFSFPLLLQQLLTLTSAPPPLSFSFDLVTLSDAILLKTLDNPFTNDVLDDEKSSEESWID
jgi:hypothetical protein